jgi:hypothetical protein
VPHARTQIINAIVTECTGLATTGGRVFKQRKYPYEDADLPGLTVNQGEEENLQGDSEGSTLGKVETRLFDINIVAHARDNNQVEDTLNQICTEVDAGIMDDPTLGDLVNYISLLGTDEPEFSEEQQKPVGRITTRWRCSYRLKADATSTLPA